MHRLNRYSVVCLLLIQMPLASCGDLSGVIAAPPPPTNHKVHIKPDGSTHDDVNGIPDSKLSQGSRDTITWQNDSGYSYYVCFSASNPDLQPFNAIVWYLPNGKSRDSGQIRDDAKQTTLEYVVSKKFQSCTSFTNRRRVPRGNPKIVINP